MLVIGILVACSVAPAPISNPPISRLRVVMDNNYPPYAFLDGNGNLQGILIDQWRAWEDHTGVKAEIIGLPWGEAQERMKAGEFDVIDTLFYTEERAKIYDFGKPYAKINVRIFFRKSISGISNAQNLKGFRVAVKTGDADVDYLLGQGVTSLIYYENYEQIVQAATNNEENVFVIDEPPALYFLFKNDIRDEFNFSEPLYSGEFHRAVRKGNTAILELVYQGFSSISAQEYQEIDDRWFGTRQTNELISLLPYLGAGFGLAFVVILFLLFFNRTLHTRVNERTKELEETLVHLKASEVLFRDSIEFLPIPIGIANAQGTILGVNQKFTEHYGFTIEDIPTIDDWIMIAYPDPVYREKALIQWNADVANALENGTNTPLREYCVTGKDGSLHDVEIIMRPVGELWVASFVEVTERKKTETVLREGRERYQAVVDNQTEFIVRWRPDRTRTFVNDAYCRYFGLTREEAMETDFMSLIFEEDRQAVQENISRIEQGLINAEAEIHRVTKSDGSIGWNEWIDTPIRDSTGKIIEFQSVGRDITSHKLAEDKVQESEKRYRALFEDSPVPLFEEDFSGAKKYIDELRASGIYDLNSYFQSHPTAIRQCLEMVQIVDVNKAALKWNQRRTKSELCGSLGEHIPETEYESFLGELVKLSEGNGHYEIIVSRHDITGTPLHLIVNGTVAPGFEETWERVLVSILDITDRKIAEEKLLNAYDNTLWGWAHALEFRDKETEGHSRRVVEITLKLAQALGVSEEDELTCIRRGTILHDIGKLGIPDDILLKPGNLTDAEWQIMSQHPWLGFKLLAPIDFLKDSLDIVRYHHEKWDGSGYLSGLRGEEIPLAARIFAIVDVWDAVQSDRPYKKAWSRKQAIALIRNETGKHFDPKIADIFLSMVEDGKI